jgi:enoyl-CoA hydratase/carnithine racemase
MESNSSFFLPRLIGYSNATYLVVTGETFPANSTLFAGLFQELIDKQEDVLPRALALAETLVSKTSLLASYLNRELIWHNPGSAEATHLVDSPTLYHMFNSGYACPLTKALSYITPFANKIAETVKKDLTASWRNASQHSKIHWNGNFPLTFLGGCHQMWEEEPGENFPSCD